MAKGYYQQFRMPSHGPLILTGNLYSEYSV
jgi:hypothetical protein